jgi:hypothetical protein
MKYVIAGFGKFGRLALERLIDTAPANGIIVVEHKKDLHGIDDPRRVHTVRGDIVSVLLNSPALEADDMIIPMVPFHLAAAFLLATLPDAREISLPQELAGMVPNPWSLNDSNLCCSRSDFICPDDCPEGDVCAVTGEPRDEPLYQFIRLLEIPGFAVLVQRSFQILPGIGGYSLGDLWKLRGLIDSGKYIVATSCKCHGIMTGIRR